MTNLYFKDRILAEQMRAAQAGDAQAYADLLRTVAPWLRQVIKNRRTFLQPADIEDLLQDVLLSLHAVRGTYDSKRPFLPWLLAITRNRLADAVRRYARHNAIDQLDVTLSEEATNIEAESHDDSNALHKAIRELPLAQRQAIEMVRLREMSFKEAAAASGTSVGALKVSVHRAIKTLRRALKG